MTESASHHDPFRFTTIAHAGRAVLGPVAIENIERLFRAITLPDTRARAGIVDIGCGKGEILLRAMRHFGALGTGVEPNPHFAAGARARARERDLESDLVLHELPTADAPLAGESFELAICTGAIHAFGDLPGALDALAHLVPGRGCALVATGYWRRTPDAAYLAAFGGREDELLPLEAALALPQAHRWSVAARHLSTLDEWDDYESAYARNVREWLRVNPGDPDAGAFRQRIESWNAAYRRWGRDTMGYVTVALKREP